MYFKGWLKLTQIHPATALSVFFSEESITSRRAAMIHDVMHVLITSGVTVPGANPTKATPHPTTE